MNLNLFWSELEKQNKKPPKIAVSGDTFCTWEGGWECKISRSKTAWGVGTSWMQLWEFQSNLKGKEKGRLEIQ